MLCALALVPAVLGGTALAAEAPAEAGGFGSYSMIIMIVAMVAIFYFLMIRPESKKKKKLAEMRASLTVGDTITTIGGLIGKVVSIDDEKVTFETSEDRVRIQVTKWAISTVGKDTPAEEPK